MLQKSIIVNENQVEVSSDIDLYNFTNEQIVLINELADSLNEMVKAGYLNISSNTLTITNKLARTLENAMTIATRSGGVTKAVSKGGTTIDVYLDNTLSNKVASGIGIGAALSALFPDPIVSKTIGIALGLCSGLIAYNNEGNGVIVTITGGTPVWIRPQ